MDEIQESFDQKKEIYENLLSFLEAEIDENIEFQTFVDYIFDQNLHENKDEMRSLLHQLSKISQNHHRSPNLITKIERILTSFDETIKKSFSSDEIFNLFKYSKRVLLFLFENKYIELNEYIVYFILKSEQSKYPAYFYPEIKNRIDSQKTRLIEDRFFKCNPDNLIDFENKRKIGENDSYICSLIREDLVEEFISYVNKKNISLVSKIEQSIFETNSFLFNKEPTLIEYSVFFGSIQIFQYLILNNVKLSSTLWLYSIHGKNADIIHLLEENNVTPDDKTYSECFEESIKCHHNDIASYIQNNYLNQKNENFDNEILSYAFHYHNSFYFPDDFNNKYIFYYACEYDYIELVKLCLDFQDLNVNNTIISILFY